MDDYFFECSEARGELAACRVTIKALIDALPPTETNNIMAKVAKSLGQDQLISIDKVLSKRIGYNE